MATASRSLATALFLRALASGLLRRSYTTTGGATGVLVEGPAPRQRIDGFLCARSTSVGGARSSSTLLIVVTCLLRPRGVNDALAEHPAVKEAIVFCGFQRSRPSVTD
jgi:hypothetical protein